MFLLVVLWQLGHCDLPKYFMNAMERVVLRRQVSEFSGQSTPMPDNNLLRLKRISQSFDDLTSETLYSKWKKARKNGAKTDQRNRSTSLSSLPEEVLDINSNETDTTAASLRRQIFRPRGWSVCNGELSRDKEKGVLNTSNIPADNLSDSRLSTNEVDRSTITIDDSSENLDDDVFSVSTSKPKLKDSIETKKTKIINEIISGTASRVPSKKRSLTDSDRVISEVSSGRCRLMSDPNATGRRNSESCARSLSCREAREIEFLRTAEMAQRYLDNSKTPGEDIWQKRSSTGDIVAEGRHKRIPRSRSLIHARSEVNNNASNIQEASLGFPNDRSQPDASRRYVLGRTYALIRQPEPRITNSNQDEFSSELNSNTNLTTRIHHRAMSEPSHASHKKESRSNEEKEKDGRTVKFKEVEFCDSDYKSHRSEGHGVRRAQTLPRMPKRPLASINSRNWKESEIKTRKAAEDLIHNINKSDDKSSQERVDVVETAFEWIRKEVADLRAQDKDIMRMFTKIQAGIRHIKFDQSSLMEEEEFISTPDLSSTSSGTSLQRRASLL